MAEKDKKLGRTIYFKGSFNENSAYSTVEKLLEFEFENPEKDVVIYIDSHGGSVDSFLAIYDAMQLVNYKIATICIGKAMSCGQMLLMSGTPGLRFITPNARVLIHEITSGSFGKVSDMEVDINESRRLQKVFADLIVKRTSISRSKLKEMLKTDTYFSATEALKAGLVDHVLKSNKELYKRIKR
jgi:ATP-dependent Clp protease protease subunit